MKKVLISSFDMEIGGVERSLISMLENFDYYNNCVDLMLYKHQGDFMKFLPKKHNLLPEIEEYASFRKSIIELFKEKSINLAICRLKAKLIANKIARNNNILDESYIQMQLMWNYSIKYLPKVDTQYDVAISYLWPHYFVAEKVKAKKKIAWIHTDYSTIETNIDMDLKMWNKFDYIMAVSEECKNAFLKKYPILKNKVKIMENITSIDFIRKIAQEDIEKSIKNDNSFKLVSVARLSYAKGIDNAVKALKILHDRGLTDIKWYVVGYGGDEDMIRNIINENNLENSFILLGKKINPYPYMKTADLYIQPSRYEGKAVTVTEAQILGRTVMITNYPTAKSQVKDKYNGYICKASVEGIVRGIENLYNNKRLREKLAENCRNIDYSNKYELEKLYSLF